ncbi:GAF domain-containing protein [Crocinitomix algicola]|uniref:GAF domain-containing protein n=1 Tax=Crocinitomix algicola TaxID=1740263 RepID=UPI00082F34B4|nr:GAF domain-containing protein [Crocinitomix algicola]
MSEELQTIEGSKKEQYKTLIPQLKALIEGEDDVVANLSNIAAALRQTFGFFWVGFYLVKNDELVLGPFQGDIACTRIQKGKGVCGTAWANETSIIVPNVNQFQGHIACSSQSQSEIVVPIIKDGKVRSVIDVDSKELDDFDEIDQVYLEELAKILSDLF